MSADELFDAIPVFGMGCVPEEIIDAENPAPYRTIIAKRAIAGSYENVEPESIADLLSDLRHLCDACRLDFAEMDRRARDNYLAEWGASVRAKAQPQPVEK